MNLSTWTQKYLKEAIDDEIGLAVAKHGGRIPRPTNITIFTELAFAAPARTHGNSLSNPRNSSGGVLPQWRRDWRSAGPLLAQLGLSVRHDAEEGTVSVGTGNRRRDVTEAYIDHPGADEATVAAIVRAATQAFNEARESA